MNIIKKCIPVATLITLIVIIIALPSPADYWFTIAVIGIVALTELIDVWPLLFPEYLKDHHIKQAIKMAKQQHQHSLYYGLDYYIGLVLIAISGFMNMALLCGLLIVCHLLEYTYMKNAHYWYGVCKGMQEQQQQTKTSQHHEH